MGGALMLPRRDRKWGQMPALNPSHRQACHTRMAAVDSAVAMAARLLCEPAFGRRGGESPTLGTGSMPPCCLYTL